MIEIKQYSPSDKEVWDNMVNTSKNGTFLLCRDYMEYHSDRFEDYSMMIYEDGELAALLPACRMGDTISSHGGLTYGGLVMGYRTSGDRPLEWLRAVVVYLRDNGFSKLIYKNIPHIYHRQPAEEDLYALFRLGATLTIRNLATVIDIQNPIKSSRLGKRAVKRQRLGEITVEPTDRVADFWHIIMEDRRIRHNTVPVHTKTEMELLHSRFPDNIRLYVAKRHGRVIAGAVLFVSNGVIHLQYAAGDEEGKQLYATDVIYHDIIFNRHADARYFDFGTSNERAGQYLNTGMVRHKEEFGGRSVVYDTYEIVI
ncbi:MAG: GNAT family N-acetyltransferase [Pseudoflavonifractor sp.]|nr:GNAT family N-acetyltransferase [Pseudoflavonifractor sp.]